MKKILFQMKNIKTNLIIKTKKKYLNGEFMKINLEKYNNPIIYDSKEGNKIVDKVGK